MGLLLENSAISLEVLYNPEIPVPVTSQPSVQFICKKKGHVKQFMPTLEWLGWSFIEFLL